jgi:hypothetical protein
MSIIFHTFFTENKNEKLRMVSPLFRFYREKIKTSQKSAAKVSKNRLKTFTNGNDWSLIRSFPSV